MQHYTVTFQPDGKSISIHHGATLLEAAARAGIILNTPCGGRGICGKCVLHIEPSNQTVRACQYTIESELTVTVPPSSRLFGKKILDTGVCSRPEFSPDIYKSYAELAGAADILGVAVDIGTTTVVAKLVDMTTGQLLATESDYNPQAKYGDDVISRISYASTLEKLAELQKIIVDCINNLIGKLCAIAQVKPDRIYELVAVGNTTMSHILLRLPVEQLGRAPYSAYSLDAYDLPAKQMNILANNRANLHTVENISGFVGSDTIAAALAVGIDLIEDTTLLVDIGTNGELVLGTKDRLYAASCAAGPAFEGARITHGSRAVNGAIEAVVANDDIDVDVIGNLPAKSICGSGLIDAVSVLLNLGIIDSTGRLKSPDQLKAKVPPSILQRIITRDSQPAFILAYNNSSEPAVVLTQKDIRELQLAKAAIRAGITILLKKQNIDESRIERVLLAGAFGNYIRTESAIRIGLLPDIPAGRIQFVGNAASCGAQMILLSSHARHLAGQLAKKIEYVEIAHQPDFAELYAEMMSF